HTNRYMVLLPNAGTREPPAPGDRRSTLRVDGELARRARARPIRGQGGRRSWDPGTDGPGSGTLHPKRWTSRERTAAHGRKADPSAGASGEVAGRWMDGGCAPAGSGPGLSP